jgi:hypothetical protein
LEDLDLLEASCVWAVFGWVVGEAMEAMLKWWQKGGQKELPAAPMEQPAIAALQKEITYLGRAVTELPSSFIS